MAKTKTKNKSKQNGRDPQLFFEGVDKEVQRGLKLLGFDFALVDDILQEQVEKYTDAREDAKKITGQFAGQSVRAAIQAGIIASPDNEYIAPPVPKANATYLLNGKTVNKFAPWKMIVMSHVINQRIVEVNSIPLA